MAKKRISVTLNESLDKKLTEKAKMLKVSKGSLASLAISHLFSQMELLEKSNGKQAGIYDVIRSNYQQQIFENEKKMNS
jgi:metal-responsive CopG/Arc/MetJ family transcriptional regulator